MHIEFVRTGGFAGLRVTLTVETAALPPEEAREVEALVHQARFFQLPATIPGPAAGAAGGADRFHYRLTVEAGERRHTVEVGEPAVPDSLRPLVQRLTSLARRRR